MTVKRVQSQSDLSGGGSRDAPALLTVEEAAPIIGLTRDALWARLRRGDRKGDGQVRLGPGLLGIRIGKKSWRVVVSEELRQHGLIK